jgi:purine-binding chemotaxis protein CheW
VNAPATDAVSRDVTIGLLRCGDDFLGVRSTALLEVAPIRQLEPILSTEAAVIGAMALRGAIVPVCDPHVLCGLDSRSGTPAIAAIVSDGDGMLALGVDGISGLRRFAGSAAQRLHAEDADVPLLGHVILDGKLVHLMDTDRIFAEPRLPRATRRHRSRAATASTASSKHLTFSAGGVLYALSAEHIFGTVPRQEIAERWIGDDMAAGCITFQNRRIPVVEPCGLFSLGGASSETRPEYVVIRMPEDRLLALAVDSVCRIQDVTPSAARTSARRSATGSPLLRDTFEVDGSVVFVLDAERILADPDLLTISDLSRREVEATGATGMSSGAATRGDDHAVIHESVRMLIFSCGGRFAAPITHVSRILEPPGATTPCRSRVPGLERLFMLDGQPTPLVRLSSHLRLNEDPAARHRRVLVSGPPEARIGFVVDAIEGIADSDWRSRPEARLPGGYDLVQLRNRGDREVVDRLDLDAIADDIARSWQGAATA